jgi:hypothetical protein
MLAARGVQAVAAEVVLVVEDQQMREAQELQAKEMREV